MPNTPALDPQPTDDAQSTTDGRLIIHDRTGAARIPAEGAKTSARYVLADEIARGGMGVVYSATDTVLARQVAVKALDQRYAPDSSTAWRFTDEARITGQLQHPNIPAVHDLGVLPDGRPFLAMKLIRGHTLDNLLKRRAHLAEDRGRFVAVFEQICQAVAYAHAHDVIHRDLKPANVMVGAFGEVQVMDWGLAKVLGVKPEEPTDPEETKAFTMVSSLRESNDPLTRTGSVLGTPAFMAPEQAAGAVGMIDRRSDVFGLGAVLGVILTGRPPFEADTSEATRVKAAQGDIGECFARLDTCEADPDLVALCKRCLAPRPEDRPADADEVAKTVAALRAAADERARKAEARAGELRQRRRLLLAASGVIALVLLAGLGASLWQMQRAIEAEAAATTSAGQARKEASAKALALMAEQKARQDETKARQQAFAALRTMTADVVERKFAQATVLTEDDRDFLRGIITQYDAFAAIKADDADSRALRAEGRFRVANMRHTLGELKEAERDYNQAVSILKKLAADFPVRPEFRHDLAKAHQNRGRLFRQTGRLAQAQQDYAEALTIHQQLAADFPAQGKFRRDLANSLNSRGNLLRGAGRFQEAEKDLDDALTLYHQLAGDLANEADFRHELANTHNSRGVLRRARGRVKEAEQDYDQALAIRTQLVADFPRRPDFLQALAVSHSNRGLLRSATGRLQEAEQDLDHALRIRKQLAADFPTRIEFRRELALSHNNRGVLRSDMGRVKAAEQDYDQARLIQEQLAADFPNQPALRNELAGTYVNLAVCQVGQGHWAAAKRFLLAGRPHHLAALKANPRHPTYRQYYLNHLSVLTRVHAGLLEPKDSVQSAEMVRDLGWDASANAYDAACVLTRCLPVVAKHPQLNGSQRIAAVQFYSDAAMRFLRDAVNKGYKDIANIKEDADLDALRQRDDFKSLVAELNRATK